MHLQRTSDKRRWRHWRLIVVVVVVHSRVSASETSLIRRAPFSTAAATAPSWAPAGSTHKSNEHVWQQIETEDTTHATTSAVGDHDDIDGHDDLRTWAANRHAAPQFSPPKLVCVDCFLIVGVKTRALRGFQTRQLIRAAWAYPSIAFPLQTRVVFLGCEPDLSQTRDPGNETLRALALEKQTFGDLLTHELGGCVDSYFRLVDKALGFFHWVTRHHPSASYVMVADDDVYMRLDRLVTMLKEDTTPRTRYYAGQVTSVKFRRLVPTIREPWHKNYLSKDEYPMAEHAPRAAGAHYLLSVDLVQFLARNRHELRGVGTIEDLSIAVWLRSLLRVHPVHLRNFETTLCGICRASLASYGDLSPLAMRQIKKNMEVGDAFCHGYSWAAWSHPEGKDLTYAKLRPRSDTEYKWDFRVEPSTRTFRIDITIQLTGTFPSLALPEVSFTPTLEHYHDFCLKLQGEVTRFARRLPLTLCEDLFDRLDDYLQTYPPTSTALLALTRSNLPPTAGRFVAVNVWVSSRTIRWRMFIECLFAEIYPDIHIYVVDETTEPEPSIVVEPEFAVVSADELRSLPVFPPSCRFLIIETVHSPFRQLKQIRDRHGVIIIAHRPPAGNVQIDQPTMKQLSIPLASLAFSNSLVFSPLTLLQASSICRASLSPVETFAVPHCYTQSAAFIALVRDGSGCLMGSPGDANRITGFNIPDGASSRDTIFVLDTLVSNYSRFKFVLAFETAQTRAVVAETIVAAFLAGSVPIYDGDDETVPSLFNPKALISCVRFASLKDCGDYVMEVHHSRSLYEKMRSEPPVVNETAFYEFFSWHPDVLRRLQEREDEETAARLSVVARMQDLINSI